jgi:hypothetical protein
MSWDALYRVPGLEPKVKKERKPHKAYSSAHLVKYVGTIAHRQDFGGRLYTRREDMGLSISEAARLLRVEYGVYNCLERLSSGLTGHRRQQLIEAGVLEA